VNLPPQQFYEKFFLDENLDTNKKDYSFLFGGEGTDYYNWCLFCEKNKMGKADVTERCLFIHLFIFIHVFFFYFNHSFIYFFLF
jgi:hypothetical protein